MHMRSEAAYIYGHINLVLEHWIYASLVFLEENSNSSRALFPFYGSHQIMCRMHFIDHRNKFVSYSGL